MVSSERWRRSLGAGVDVGVTGAGGSLDRAASRVRTRAPGLFRSLWVSAAAFAAAEAPLAAASAFASTVPSFSRKSLDNASILRLISALLACESWVDRCSPARNWPNLSSSDVIAGSRCGLGGVWAGERSGRALGYGAARGGVFCGALGCSDDGVCPNNGCCGGGVACEVASMRALATGRWSAACGRLICAGSAGDLALVLALLWCCAPLRCSRNSLCAAAAAEMALSGLAEAAPPRWPDMAATTRAVAALVFVAMGPASPTCAACESGVIGGATGTPALKAMARCVG